MKGSRSNDSFIMRLGISAVVLLFTQHAFAAGTIAGTDVVNLATVDYSVNGNDQEDIESAPGLGNNVPGVGNGEDTVFEVDNRVDFSLTQVGGVHTNVTPGDTDAFVEFILANDGNAVQDFRMVATQLASADGAVFGLTDSDKDIASLRVRVGNGGGVPTTGSDDFVDELVPDETVTLYVYGNADALLGLVDGDVLNIELTATAAEGGTAGGGAPGADLVDDIGSADDPLVVDIVFAEGGVLGDGVESDRHGFLVQSAGLNVTKAVTVLDDPFNGTTDPKAIPGATVEYVITVANSGSEDAENISITDSIDTDVVFIADAYGGDDLEVVNDGTPLAACNADAGDGDTDGCQLDGADLTIGNANLAITVAAGTSLTVTYRVSIP